MRVILGILALMALVGCTTAPRPPAMCEAFLPAKAPAPAALARSAGPQSQIATILDRLDPPGVRFRSAPPLHILAVSVGGQNGAFSSGFLAGWSERGTRPEFELVTGASAGALVAPVAFLGREFDADLSRNVGLTNEDVFRKRGLLTALNAGSLFDTAPLAELVRDFYARPEVLDGLAEATRNRFLLLGATDLQSGAFRRFDIGKLMRDAPAPSEQAHCLTAATLASSAIPALFPPQNINGALHSDAGVRQSIFLSEIAQKLDAPGGGARPVVVTLLVNSPLVLEPAELDGKLLNTVTRNFEIVTDEGMRASLLRVLERARFKGWSLRAAMIREMPACTDPSGKVPGLTDGALFDPCVTQGLYDQGRALALSDAPFLTASELRQALEKGRADP